MENNNKSRILYILKFLEEDSDELHPISITDIIENLGKHDIKAHRRTIMTDIESLKEFGIDIITVKSTQNRYFIGNRDFELPEVKLLIENEEVYYTVDSIHDAINSNKQIEFKYYQYTGRKEKIFKNDGYVYSLSPYALIWSEDHYYVIGFSRKHNKISKFRVDRMAQTKITAMDSMSRPESFDVAEYAKSVFEMFDGETRKVELKCTNDLMDVIVDRFGESVNTTELGSNCFKAIVDISISPTFYGWVFGFGNKMSILAPIDVKNEYIAMARSVVS